MHYGRINSLSMCAWKPIFMTSGEEDKSIRIWNYMTDEVEMIKLYQEEIHCISLHPTGIVHTYVPIAITTTKQLNCVPAMSPAIVAVVAEVAKDDYCLTMVSITHFFPQVYSLSSVSLTSSVSWLSSLMTLK